ncbi:MAG: hypothetical protein AB8B96_22190 [Lysobacterales bacterium]
MHRYIDSYVHNGRIGVLVELATNDDFTARTEEFAALARDLAIHIAAMDPIGISEVELESLQRAWPHARPVQADSLLLSQRFVRSDTLTVGQHIRRTERQLGSQITVHRFLRWTCDE